MSSKRSSGPSAADAPDQDQRLWLAWCYLLGELEPPARDEFERQLAEDQAAREALAECVALHEALLAAGPPRAVPTRPTQLSGTARSLRRLAATLAAALLLMLWLWWTAGPLSFGPGPGGVAVDTQELADAWLAAQSDTLPPGLFAQETGEASGAGQGHDVASQLADQADDASSPDRPARAGGQAADPQQAMLAWDADDEPDEAELAAPSWLLVAVQDLSHGPEQSQGTPPGEEQVQ